MSALIREPSTVSVQTQMVPNPHFVSVSYTEKDITETPESIRVFQWNVLADSLATGDKGGFPKVSDDSLDTDKRRAMQFSVIKAFGADLVALQEVDAPNDFTEFLEGLGYETHYAKRRDSPLGLLIAWRKSQFEFIRFTEASYERSGQIALFVHLEEDGVPFVFATTHLKSTGTPDDTDRYRKARAIQAAQLDEFKACLGERGQVNQIICGDFNMSDPDFGMNSSHTKDMPTTFKARSCGEKICCEDHIATTFPIAQRSILPDAFPSPLLPSETYPSDHVSLCADIVLDHGNK